MSAYIVFIRNKTHDPEGMLPYHAIARSLSPEKFEFEMVASSTSKFQILEGDPEAEFAVILRFPTMEKALAWYNSKEYQEAVAIRQRVAESCVILVEGNN